MTQILYLGSAPKTAGAPHAKRSNAACAHHEVSAVPRRSNARGRPGPMPGHPSWATGFGKMGIFWVYWWRSNWNIYGIYGIVTIFFGNMNDYDLFILYPLVMTVTVSYWKLSFIVTFPIINSMVIFHSFLYVYQRVIGKWWKCMQYME